MKENNDSSDRHRIIWNKGVFGWGIISSIIWSVLVYFIKNDGITLWRYIFLGFIVFPLMGYFWGHWLWKRHEHMQQDKDKDIHRSNGKLFGILDPTIFPNITDLPDEKVLKVKMIPTLKLAWIGLSFFSLLTLLAILIQKPALSVPPIFFYRLVHLSFIDFRVYRNKFP